MSGSSSLASAGGDDLGLHAEIAAARMRHLQPVEPLRRVGELQAAGQVQPAGLPGDRFDLLVEADGVGLQLGDVRVAVQRVEAARRVPGRAGGQLAPLDQHHVAPAGLGQMVEHRAADDAAADHRDLDMGFHGFARPRKSCMYQAAAIPSISSSQASSKMPVMIVVRATFLPARTS